MDIMDNTMDASELEKIYEGKWFWIGRIGGSQFQAFYLVVSDQRAVASLIAIGITPADAKRIIDSHGDPEIVAPLARDMSHGYLYVR